MFYLVQEVFKENVTMPMGWIVEAASKEDAIGKVFGEGRKFEVTPLVFNQGVCQINL